MSIHRWSVEFLCKLLKAIPESPRSGLFCSQLVASIFRDGKFPLSDAPTNTVTPELIARSSKIRRITGIVCRQLTPHEELRKPSHTVDALLPGFIDEFAMERAITREKVARILDPGINSDERTRTWLIRDKLDIIEGTNRRLADMLDTVEKISKMAREVIEGSEGKGSR